jgi:hypothetical protein
MERGLPLPVKNDSELVIISIKETRKKYMGGGGLDKDDIIEKVNSYGFKNILYL